MYLQVSQIKFYWAASNVDIRTHTRTTSHTHTHTWMRHLFDVQKRIRRRRVDDTFCQHIMQRVHDGQNECTPPLAVITEMQQVPSEIASTQMADKYGARTMAALRENQQQRQQQLCTVFLCKFTRNCNRLVVGRTNGARGEHDPQRVDGW